MRKEPIFGESLADLFPDLILEWNDDENPFKLKYGSAVKITWKCKTCAHSWKAAICDRTISKSGCPASGMENND
jgi:Probable Zinc-ribbon domain